MRFIVDKVATTRHRIDPENAQLTQDDPPPAPLFAEEITLLGLDSRATFTMMLDQPDLVGKFKPGEIYNLSLQRVQ